MAMKILVACEFSGVVRDAFRARGHSAISCDILPSERPGPHRQEDVTNALRERWDMIVAFPPCTHLCVSGARWWPGKRPEQREAVAFVLLIARANAPRIAIENPIGLLSTVWRKPDQIIQPWMFGHGETKATCLWLHGLPRLVPTDIVPGREARVHKMAPGPARARERSRTYTGLAQAMAAQWG